MTTFYQRHAAHRRIFAIAEEQQAQGWQVEFIVGRNASLELIREKREQGFVVTQISSLTKYVHPREEIKALLDLDRHFLRERYDLIHTHYAKPGILGRLAGRLAGAKKLVHSVYGPTFAPILPVPTRLLYRSLERLAGRVTSQFIFIGQEIQETYIRAGICTALNSKVIYGGRDLSPFIQAGALEEKSRRARKKALGLKPETIVIGYVARTVPSKGHIYAVQALRQLSLNQQQACLLFVGDGVVPQEQLYAQHLKQEIKQLGMEKKVIIAGWQNRPDHFYSLFDIFVFPSLYEGLPGAVLEARAADLPIVAFDCGGVREALGNKGSLVPVKDVAGLARGLQQEIERLPETNRRRGQNSQELGALQERFSMKKMVTETMELYRQLLGHTGSISALS